MTLPQRMLVRGFASCQLSEPQPQNTKVAMECGKLVVSTA
jgi:hypothetical protein